MGSSRTRSPPEAASVPRPAVTPVIRPALSTSATDGSDERHATACPDTGCPRASTTRATSRATPPSPSRTSESPWSQMAAGRERTRMRDCAIRPPAAATTVDTPGDRATTVPALSTEATDVSVEVHPTPTPATTPPCASVMVMASWIESPMAQAVSAMGRTPIQRTWSAGSERTDDTMETRAAPADSEPAPHFHALTIQVGPASAASRFEEAMRR